LGGKSLLGNKPSVDLRGNLLEVSDEHGIFRQRKVYQLRGEEDTNMEDVRKVRNGKLGQCRDAKILLFSTSSLCIDHQTFRFTYLDRR
jgi:hypothetical protein